MSTRSIRPLAMVAALLASAGASAQPAGAPPVAPPDTGPIVVVASNPLAWLVELYGLSVSVALHDRIALHVDTNYFDHVSGGDTVKAYEIALGVTFYPMRTFSGPLVEPAVRLRREFEDCKNCGDFPDDLRDIHTRTTTVGPELLVGWQWTIGSTVSVALAFGLLYNVNHHTTSYSASGEPLGTAIEPDGYARLGVAF